MHKKQCKKLQQVFSPPPPAGWRERSKVGVDGVRGSGAEGGGGGAQQRGVKEAVLWEKMKTRTCAQSAWTTQMMRMWTKSGLPYAQHAVSCTAVLAMPGLANKSPNLPNLPRAHSLPRLKSSSSGCGSWCTTGRQGGTRHMCSTSSAPAIWKAGALSKTTLKHSSGSNVQPTMAMVLPWVWLVSTTGMVKVLRKTVPRLSSTFKGSRAISTWI